MSLTAELQRVLDATVEGWFRNFAGTTALDVARELDVDHDMTMRLFEELESLGFGSLNRDAGFVQMSFDPENPSAGFKQEPITTHVFFPSKEILRKAFFESGRPQQRLPEYTTRLHLGAHQIGLAYFHEEVLTRYLDHPELYEVNDSLAGGDVSALDAAPEERYLYVRYGKCRLKSGTIAVTAIYKDLADMSPSEQRYWHSHEIDSPEVDRKDVHFQNFLRRTYDGDWVDFEDPITRVYEAVAKVNAAIGGKPLLNKTKNIHLRFPVEQTYKSYCDAASELYKLVGPDNISQGRLKSILTTRFGVKDGDLVHPSSGRPMSTLQMLAMLEQKIGQGGLVSEPVRAVGELRIEADHKILEPDAELQTYSRKFAEICNQVAESFEQLADSFEESTGDA
jgi:hypothetical protein